MAEHGSPDVVAVAVSAALAASTGSLGFLFAFALQTIFFWAVDDAGPTRALKHDAPDSRSATAGRVEAIIPASTPVAPSEESDPPPGLRPAPADMTRSKRAARRFLAGYLRFSYDHGAAAPVRSASLRPPTTRGASGPIASEVSRREFAARTDLPHGQRAVGDPVPRLAGPAPAAHGVPHPR